MGIITRSLGTASALFDEYSRDVLRGDIYLNQMECAVECIKSFDKDTDRNNFIICLAETQQGKTGVLQCLTYCIFSNTTLRNAMGIRHILCVTGDNTCGLKSQTQFRFWPLERYLTNNNINNIDIKFYKNSDLRKLIKNDARLPNLSHTLVLIDESHFGTDSNNNILNQYFKQRNFPDIWQNPKRLEDNHVYVVSCSATPFNEIRSDEMQTKSICNLNVNRWNDELDNGYVGIPEFINEECLRIVGDSLTKELVEEMYNYLIKLNSKPENKESQQRCAMIRLTEDQKNKLDFNLKDYFEIMEFNCKEGKIPYDEIMNVVAKNGTLSNQKKPLCVLVKGSFRHGITIKNEVDRHICKDLISVVYENIKSDPQENIETTIQGLLGRMCGFRNNNLWKDKLIYINEKHFNLINEIVSGKTAIEIKDGLIYLATITKRQFIADEESNDIGIIEIPNPLAPNEVKIKDLKMTIDEEKNLFTKGTVYRYEIDDILKRNGIVDKESVLISPRRNISKTSSGKLGFDYSSRHGIYSTHIRPNVGRNCYTILIDCVNQVIKFKYGHIYKGRETEIKTYIRKMTKNKITNIN